MANQQTVHHASTVFLPARFLGCSDDLARNDSAVGSCDFRLLHLAWNHLLDLVFEANRYLRHVCRGDGRFDQVSAAGGKDWPLRIQKLDNSYFSTGGIK